MKSALMSLRQWRMINSFLLSESLNMYCRGISRHTTTLLWFLCVGLIFSDKCAIRLFGNQSMLKSYSKFAVYLFSTETKGEEHAISRNWCGLLMGWSTSSRCWCRAESSLFRNLLGTRAPASSGKAMNMCATAQWCSTARTTTSMDTSDSCTRTLALFVHHWSKHQLLHDLLPLCFLALFCALFTNL